MYYLYIAIDKTKPEGPYVFAYRDDESTAPEQAINKAKEFMPFSHFKTGPAPHDRSTCAQRLK